MKRQLPSNEYTETPLVCATSCHNAHLCLGLSYLCLVLYVQGVGISELPLELCGLLS